MRAKTQNDSRSNKILDVDLSNMDNLFLVLQEYPEIDTLNIDGFTLFLLLMHNNVLNSIKCITITADYGLDKNSELLQKFPNLEQVNVDMGRIRSFNKFSIREHQKFQRELVWKQDNNMDSVLIKHVILIMSMQDPKCHFHVLFPELILMISQNLNELSAESIDTHRVKLQKIQDTGRELSKIIDERIKIIKEIFQLKDCWTSIAHPKISQLTAKIETILYDTELSSEAKLYKISRKTAFAGSFFSNRQNPLGFFATNKVDIADRLFDILNSDELFKTGNLTTLKNDLLAITNENQQICMIQ